MSNFLALAAAVAACPELFSPTGKKNFDEYPSLKTDKETPEDWWNSLNCSQAVDVGGFAVHMRIMTANCRWGCGNFETEANIPYSTLPKSQRDRIIKCFNRRNDDFVMLDLASMLKF
jgi:hypothetical protein